MRSLKRYALPLGLAAAALPAAAAEGGGSSLIEPKFGTIFWTLITFGALVFVLGRYAWKPLLGALREREGSIEESLEQARCDRQQAESLLAQQRELVEQSRRERAAAVEHGRRDAEKLKADILDEARAQRQKMLEQTQLQIEAGMRQARAELRSDTVDLALAAAKKLLVRSLDETAHRTLIEEYLAELERSAGTESRPS
ncbi:MAG TPA: F0F1 ATP synthase subunit B [Candidatus Polarisedimenticolaceae bacterium]|nr:F0F1 ATP synthase subunit B [Candidatus Polarisedimenticolaceae bacterium]